VLVLQSGRAQARTVRLGLRTLGAVEVQDGLAEGDAVLRHGSAVMPGQRVRPQVIRWQPAAARLAGQAEDAGAALTGAMGR
jgi:HlyD family secretion protein